MAEDRYHGEKFAFLGFGFDPLTAEDALAAIASYPLGASFAYVVTPNADHAVRLDRRRAALSAVYESAWLTLCDSRILARLASLSKLKLPVVTGSDLTAQLLERVVDRADRIAVLGSNSSDIEALRTIYGFTNLVHHNPPMGFIDDPQERARAVQFVVEAQARFTFLAVGSPRQEMIAHDVWKTGCATGIGLCIGASLEFLTGTQKRAPRIAQQLHLEWLWRLLSDPKRLWRRYLVEGPAVFALYRRWQQQHQF